MAALSFLLEVTFSDASMRFIGAALVMALATVL